MAPGTTADSEPRRTIAAALLGAGVAWLAAPPLWSAPVVSQLAFAAAAACWWAIPGLDRAGARVAALGLAAAGVALWATSPRAWWIAAAALLGAAAWRGLGRAGAAPLGRGGVAAVGVALGGPLALMGLAMALGGDDARALVVGEWEAAMAGASAPWSVVSLVLATVLSGVPAHAATRPRRSVPAAVSMGALAVLAALLVARLVWWGSVASLPADARWCEPPFLMNQLKLAAGEAVYGPMSLANSYSYSPAMELVHRGLLAPLGAALDIRAHRALVALWHLATVAPLAWALRRRSQRSGGSSRALAAALALVAAAVVSSLLAPNVHPDHPLMACFAVALALLVEGDRLPRRTYLALLFLVPPVATAFKLTGAGIGVGLVVVHLWRRRVDALVVLALSGVTALATIPLYDATLGAFSDYAIGLQASHHVRWGAWTEMLAEPPAVAAIAVGIVVASLAATARGRGVRDGVAIAVLTAATMLPSAVAYLKVGGRTNSLLPMVVGAAFALALALVTERASTGRLACVAAWAALALIPPRAPVTGRGRALAVARFERTARWLRRAQPEGPILLYGNTAAWIAAGRRDVPLDRWQSAAELALGDHPEVEPHFARLADHYRTVIVPARVLRAPDPVAPRVRAILKARYRRAEPPDDADPGLQWWSRRQQASGR